MKKDKFVVNTSDLTDQWSVAQEALASAANEQTAADIGLVEAQRAALIAQKNLETAIKRKTTAEKRLAGLRSRLGAEK